MLAVLAFKIAFPKEKLRAERCLLLRHRPRRYHRRLLLVNECRPHGVAMIGDSLRPN